jgi:uncharacterized protein
MTGTPTTVVHNETANRYELHAGDRVIGVADYRLPAGGDVAVVNHTLIEPAERGKGNAARLVAAALDDLRRRGLRVRPTCWYVDQFITEHPDYADLRA